jgi:hypothetical protein
MTCEITIPVFASVTTVMNDPPILHSISGRFASGLALAQPFHVPRY